MGHLLVRLLAPLTHSLALHCLLHSHAPLRSFIRLLAHSLIPELVNEYMSQNGLVLAHSALQWSLDSILDFRQKYESARTSAGKSKVNALPD